MAAEQLLQLVIEAKDEASKALNNVGESAKKMGLDFGKATDSSKALAGAVLGVAAGVGGVLALSLKEAADAQKLAVIAGQNLYNAFNEVEGGIEGLTDKSRGGVSMMEQLKDQMGKASEAALKLGFDDDTAAVSFSKLVQATHSTTQAQKDMALAMDLAANKGISLEEATSTIVKIHAGATRVLKDYGIEVAEGTTATEALALVQDKVGGTAEAMAGTLEGQTKIFQQNIGNLQQALGDLLLPAVNGIVGGLNQWLDSMGGVQGVITAANAWIEQHKTLLIILAGAIAGALVPALFAAATAMWAFISPLIPFMIAGAAVTAVILGIKAAIDNWGAISGFVSGIWESVSKATTDAFNKVMAVVQFAIDFVQGLLILFLDFVAPGWRETFQAIADFTTEIWGVITGAISFAWDGIKGVFQKGGEIIKGIWKGVWDSVKGMFDDTWEQIKGGFRTAINWLAEKIEGFINSAIRAINKVATVGGAVGSGIPEVNLPRLAAGGNVVRSGAAIVGEKGAELVSLPTGARVTPLTGGNASGLTINVNLQGANILADNPDSLGEIIAEAVFNRLQLQTKVII